MPSSTTTQNGKGSRPRNNHSKNWYENYPDINWERKEETISPELLASMGEAIKNMKKGIRSQPVDLDKLRRMEL